MKSVGMGSDVRDTVGSLEGVEVRVPAGTVAKARLTVCDPMFGFTAPVAKELLDALGLLDGSVMEMEG